MKKWFIVALIVLLAGIVLLMWNTTAHAQGPNLDRCQEYLNPYAPTEWERCVGNEFNKFPKAPSKLKEAYLNAPVTGQWPGPQVVELGYNAPMVNLPAVDFNGQVYILATDARAYAEPVISQGAPVMDYWRQQPPSELPQLPQTNEYTAWQNYWMSGGAAPYNVWAHPQAYATPGQ